MVSSRFVRHTRTLVHQIFLIDDCKVVSLQSLNKGLRIDRSQNKSLELRAEVVSCYSAYCALERRKQDACVITKSQNLVDVIILNCIGLRYEYGTCRVGKCGQAVSISDVGKECLNCFLLRCIFGASGKYISLSVLNDGVARAGGELQIVIYTISSILLNVTKYPGTIGVNCSLVVEEVSVNICCICTDCIGRSVCIYFLNEVCCLLICCGIPVAIVNIFSTVRR